MAHGTSMEEAKDDDDKLQNHPRQSIRSTNYGNTIRTHMTIRWLDAHKQQQQLRRQRDTNTPSSSSQQQRLLPWTLLALSCLLLHVAVSNLQSLTGMFPSTGRSLQLVKASETTAFQTGRLDDTTGPSNLRSSSSSSSHAMTTSSPTIGWTRIESHAQTEWVLIMASTNGSPPPAKIILLWDGESCDLLLHFIRNLQAADYYDNSKNSDGHHHRIDLDILMLQEAKSIQKKEMVDSFLQSPQWNHGTVRLIDIDTNNTSTTETTISLQSRIRQIWQPPILSSTEKNNNDDPAVMIFHVNNHSNQHPKSYWYQWWWHQRQPQQQHEMNTTNPPRLAGYALSNGLLRDRISTAVANSPVEESFLFPTIDTYSGFSPLPSVWRDFIDYAGCIQAHDNNDVSMENDTWEFLEDLWNRFTHDRHLWHLYQFPYTGRPLFDNPDTWASASSTQIHLLRYSLPSSPASDAAAAAAPTRKYVFAANKSQNLTSVPVVSLLRTAVMSVVSLGQQLQHPHEYFAQFVGTLRRYYHGDVWLVVISPDGSNMTTETTHYLQQNNIRTTVLSNESTESVGKEAKTSDRYAAFETICNQDRYDLCLFSDFRHSTFQDNPFIDFYDDRPLLDNNGGEHLHIYMHEAIMNPWHFRQMAKCGIYDAYGSHVAGKRILNAGGILATPGVWKELGHYHRLWEGCNDQVVYNTWIYTPHDEVLPEHQYNNYSNKHNNEDATTATKNITMHFHRQGEGAINSVGLEGGVVEQDSRGRYVNRNCAVAPVVHHQ